MNNRYNGQMKKVKKQKKIYKAPQGKLKTEQDKPHKRRA
jgi:hypothetical protein